LIGLLYTSVAMIDSEVTSTVAAAGGQYAQAKHIVGPLMAFNVALYLVFAYTMLEVSDAILVGDTIVAKAGVEGLTHNAFLAITIVALAWLNYRGVLMTLNFNFVITALAYVAIVILFLGVMPWSQGTVLKLGEMVTPENALPYGWLGVIAAFHFGIWYYLGIEGTTQAASFRHHGRHDHAADWCRPHLVCLRQPDALAISRHHLLSLVGCRQADR